MTGTTDTISTRAPAIARPVDVLLLGGEVVDGTGAPRRRADVAIADGRIVAIGDLADRAAERRIDVSGHVVTPGFIDMHAHSDLPLLTDPDHLAKVAQGVTTEVLGQDGLSYAPVDDATLAQVRRQIAGWNGNPADLDLSWRTVGGYLDRLDRDGIAVNAVYLVPQGTLRLLVVGADDRPATPAEIEEMCAVLARSMREGAAGMSSGLTYPPGMYADTAELAALLRVVAEHGGYYSPHTRSYGRGALDAYAEMIDLARATGCPVHLTHATMNFEENVGRAGELLALVDAALDEGLDITLDSYPYLPGSTTLAALLPSWSASGGPEELLARLADPEARERIRHDVEVAGTDGCHGLTVDWATIQVSGVTDPGLTDTVGRTIAELAREQGGSGTDVFLDLLVRDQLATTILQHVGHEENVRLVMRHRAHLAGSDGILVGDRPHPRAWGTFPRYLARYSRELGLLGLEECVEHLTSRAARRLRLVDRGVVRVGAIADLVVLDPDRVRDTATFEQPRSVPEGIPYVFVGGVAAIDDGRRTGSRSGRALRRDATGDVVG
ncbi:MAG: N-acyl-D-amino-acid deacylase [Micrococcales bacterium 73-15]|uniref:N-acyl-D-amino-acid deacylase family protein n=1 Tax=Salana multivorans TaxID=120377 RepID=UPI00095E7D4B|nr:D-aminoacylase [Salana multivorans]OJX95742.1 MAG: N-acyl-D-amino-acid deacylase [Micrococcales bacterium 73-15]